MRVIIAYEGKMAKTGILLKPGALKWDELVPVSRNFDWSHQLGWARDIQREEDGSITAEVNFDVADDSSVSIFATQIKTDIEEGSREVTSADLRGLSVIPKANWPYDEG